MGRSFRQGYTPPVVSGETVLQTPYVVFYFYELIGSRVSTHNNDIKGEPHDAPQSRVVYYLMYKPSTIMGLRSPKD